MSKPTIIRHLCYKCGCKLYFYENIFKRNYLFYSGKYYCHECFNGLKKQRIVHQKIDKRKL